MGMGNVPRCQHLKMNGTQCGSPALNYRRLCFFHERIRRERVKVARQNTSHRFDLPLLEDANCVQVALMKVIQMLGAGSLDHKTAGLMLYALQTASINLRNTDFEADDVTKVVINRDNVHRTDIGGPQWDEDDFEEPTQEDEAEYEAEDEAENEMEDEADQEALVAAPLQAAALKKEPKAAKPLTKEEARLQVKGAVVNWLLETAGRKAALEPPG
jgi:hypothetical protein